MTTPCTKCGRPIEFEAPAEALGVSLKPTICNHCADQDYLHAEGTRFNRRWLAICPDIYRNTEAARIDKDKLQQVLAWQFGPRGLVLHGSTGSHKTRSMWLLIYLLTKEGRYVVSLTDGEFARQCGEAYGSGGDAASTFFLRLTSCDVLFIDDFGKCKLTERVITELFDIIEHRTRAGLPILITTNGTKKTFAEAFPANHGEPILRRLREFCTYVNFGSKK